MKPDKFDIKIQEAAAQNEAAYDEQAWSAMEKLLDEKMPQKKKDNKKNFWWFLLLCIVISGLWLTLRPAENLKITTISEKVTGADTLTNSSDYDLKNKKLSAHQKENEKIISPDQASKLQARKSFSEKKPGLTFSINHRDEINHTDKVNYKDEINHTNDKSVGSEKENPSRPDGITTIKNNSTDGPHSVNKINPAEGANEPNSAIEETQSEKPDVNKHIIAIPNKKNDSIINKKDPQTTAKRNKESASRNQFRKSFLISISAGPDISAVNINNLGRTELVYGAGVGYIVNKRWSVRAGFYVAKKGYGAKSSDYHPPARFWNYYPDLTSIDANCKVYEVPLLVNYNFSRNAKHHWFVSAGVASYFMKKEDYDYISKSPSGQISYNNYTIRNENQHYFSSLKLSAGYEKKLSSKISLTTEPYLNLPLTGIGYGKVKLYSAGILLSLDVKPF
ncbi:MAG: hypothetical protein ACTHML_02345 [Ginsengibacter sp.]